MLQGDEARRTAAFRILELAGLIDASYQQERAAAGAPPAENPLASLTDAGEIRRLLANLRPRRSKLKSRPDRAADLARIEADIHLLETKLKP
ncbi:MAG TPA: hypothetical protein VF690_03620 [Hymenobacter sp.]